MKKLNKMMIKSICSSYENVVRLNATIEKDTAKLAELNELYESVAKKIEDTDEAIACNVEYRDNILDNIKKLTGVNADEIVKMVPVTFMRNGKEVVRMEAKPIYGEDTGFMPIENEETVELEENANAER